MPRQNSRRRVILQATSAAGAFLLLFPGAAIAQPAVGASWPTCASDSQSYCIASATRDGEATDAVGNSPYEGGALIPWAMLSDTNTVSWGFKWSLDESSLPGSVGGSVFVGPDLISQAADALG